MKQRTELKERSHLKVEASFGYGRPDALAFQTDEEIHQGHMRRPHPLRRRLKRAGWEVGEASWKRYVDEYGHSLPVPKRRRSELPQIKIPLLDVANEDESHDDATLRLRKAWLERMKMKERTVVFRSRVHSTLWPSKYWQPTLHTTYLTHWEVTGNKPLTTLINGFKDLCETANTKHVPVPLKYESVVALFDEAFASQDWPHGDRALPFKMSSKMALTASQRGRQSQALVARSGRLLMNQITCAHAGAFLLP
ncbi:hypothetical protein C8Q72DRAFT_797209 [Fomitopsis betulina]|nr:hypothetical protein C8Q72DRAFT_797209 [Fomitopsis betulina]